jgi:hypothetical protein
MTRRLSSDTQCLHSGFGSIFNPGARKGQAMEWSSVKRNVLISFMIFLLSVTSAWAQTGTASLRGTVTDKTGASVGDAKVS